MHTRPEILLVQTGLDICHAIEQLEALRAATVAEIDERAVSFDTLGFRSVKQWLAAKHCWKCRPQHGSSRWPDAGQAAEIADAFNAGEISAEHAALIGKFCETPPRGMPNEALGSCRKVAGRRVRSRRDHYDRSHCISRLERIFESDELRPAKTPNVTSSTPRKP
ncbi:DUF222 domain-containing protein [Rhodococcus hoagii]|nr:DUF222 domain-containing protein [Prescottella equi]